MKLSHLEARDNLARDSGLGLGRDHRQGLQRVGVVGKSGSPAGLFHGSRSRD